MKRAVLGALGALLIAAPAQAETIQVNTTADGTSCAAQCTLKGAWLRALSTSADDTINVPAGTYTVAGGLDTLQGQFPNGRVTITGAGANATIVRQTPAPGGTATRVLTIGGGTYAVSGATLRDGDAGGANGGNVLVSAGTFTLTDVRITGGQARNGGGV